MFIMTPSTIKKNQSSKNYSISMSSMLPRAPSIPSPNSNSITIWNSSHKSGLPLQNHYSAIRECGDNFRYSIILKDLKTNYLLPIFFNYSLHSATILNLTWVKKKQWRAWFIIAGVCMRIMSSLKSMVDWSILVKWLDRIQDLFWANWLQI